jgi:transcriptional regulator with XRE-family HTH domain
MMVSMTARNAPIDRSIRRMDEDVHRVLVEFGVARRGSGLSLDAVGAACRVAGSTTARTASGATANPDLRLLAAMSASVGLELRLRTYPAGDALRDAGQQRLLERLRVRLDQRLRWRTEVALPIDGDLRAWDAVIAGEEWRIAVEAETVLDDLQALERRVALKQRDGRLDHVILLVAETRRNRRALAAAPGAFGELSRNSRPILTALRRGVDPGRGGIVVL